MIDLTLASSPTRPDFNDDDTHARTAPSGKGKDDKHTIPMGTLVSSNGSNGVLLGEHKLSPKVDQNTTPVEGVTSSNSRTKRRRKKKRRGQGVTVKFGDDVEGEEEGEVLEMDDGFVFESGVNSKVGGDEEEEKGEMMSQGINEGVIVGDEVVDCDGNIKDRREKIKGPVSPNTGRSLLDRLGMTDPQGRGGSSMETKESPRKKRNRSRERDRYRERDRERNRERDRERDKERERDRERENQRERDRDRERDKGRERDRRRERSPPSRRRSHSPESKRRVREDPSPTPKTKPPTTPPDLFYIDVSPSEIPISSRAALPISPIKPVITEKSEEKEQDKEKGENEVSKLLLPIHVTVVGDNEVVPIEILPSAPIDSEDEDYIEYLEYDDDRRVSPSTSSSSFIEGYLINLRRASSDILKTQLSSPDPLKEQNQNVSFAKIAERKENTKRSSVPY